MKLSEKILTAFFALSLMLFASAPGVRAERYRIKYSCELKHEGKSYKTSGTVLVQGAAFSLTADGLKVFNDCTDMWTIDESAKEVVVESGRTEDFMSNPFAALPLFGINAKGAEVVTRNNADGSLAGYDISLKNGDSVTLRIKKQETLPDGPVEDFSFDKKSLPKGYVVSDMR